MKYLICFITVCFISSCFLFNNEKLITKKMLADGNIIELYSGAGGATAPDIVWVKKITKSGEKYIIGKIKINASFYSIGITEIDINHISINFTDTVLFVGKSIAFTIDLNNKIERNDGSPFND